MCRKRFVLPLVVLAGALLFAADGEQQKSYILKINVEEEDPTFVLYDYDVPAGKEALVDISSDGQYCTLCMYVQD